MRQHRYQLLLLQIIQRKQLGLGIVPIANLSMYLPDRLRICLRLLFFVPVVQLLLLHQQLPSGILTTAQDLLKSDATPYRLAKFGFHHQ